MGFQFTVSGLRFWVAVFALVLIFGCLGNGTPDTGNGSQTTVPGGQATVTGNGTQETVPGDQLPVPGNETVNETVVTETGNTTQETGNGQPETAPLGTPTNLSIDGLMEQELAKLDAPGAGPYMIKTYQWKSNQFEADPQAIVINPTMQVLFDGQTEQNLVGFAFKVYEPSAGGTSSANGIAVVLNQSMLIESKMAGTFEIQFDVPGFERNLSGISMTSKDNFINDKGQLLIVYGFDASGVQ